MRGCVSLPRSTSSPTGLLSKAEAVFRDWERGTAAGALIVAYGICYTIVGKSTSQHDCVIASVLAQFLHQLAASFVCTPMLKTWVRLCFESNELHVFPALSTWCLLKDFGAGLKESDIQHNCGESA